MDVVCAAGHDAADGAVSVGQPGHPIGQPAVRVVILLAATGLCEFAAGRIFRIAVLAEGQLPKLSQLLRWIVTG